MKKLSLGMKISLGFALLILITVILGIVGILEMRAVGEDSRILAHEYVPEVAVAMELRGAANRLMYEMRGYGFTEEKQYYDNALKELNAVGEALKKARSLEEKSPHLKQLRAQIETAQKAEEEYKALMLQTVETTAKMAANRGVLDKAADTYMENCGVYLTGQNEKVKTDLDDRQSKIDIVSRLVDVGASARVLNFKAQALQSPDLLQEAVKTLDGVATLLEKLKPITTKKIDLERIERIASAAGGYQSAMKAYADEFRKGALADVRILKKSAGPWMRIPPSMLRPAMNTSRSSRANLQMICWNEIQKLPWSTISLTWAMQPGSVLTSPRP